MRGMTCIPVLPHKSTYHGDVPVRENSAILETLLPEERYLLKGNAYSLMCRKTILYGHGSGLRVQLIGNNRIVDNPNSGISFAHTGERTDSAIDQWLRVYTLLEWNAHPPESTGTQHCRIEQRALRRSYRPGS